MSAPSNTHDRQRRRWRIAVLLVVCTGAVALVRATRHAVRAERLVSEINQTDGFVRLGMPYWERIWRRLRGQLDGPGTRIKLPTTIDRQWLESRDYLADVPINFLELHDGARTGPLLAPLVTRHPIVFMMAPGATDTDQLATALCEDSELAFLELPRSDLSDAGLRQLPLEQIDTLDISDTRVTAEGLQALQRARCLTFLTLGAGQIGPVAVNLPVETSGSYTLGLRGRDVTDETLQVLVSFLNQSPTTKMRAAGLYETSVTSAGIDAWKQALPMIPIERR